MADVTGCSFLLLIIFIFPSLIEANSGERHVRYEYKFSFKGPHLMNKKGQIPFWNYGGSAIPSDEQVRVTPSLRDKKGYLWTVNKFPNQWWEIEGHFRVTGRGRVGADGFAVWYTAAAGAEGPVFGSADNWNGLAVLCDSFDNDGEQNNPFVAVMVNDGTKAYEHHNDGKNQNLGGCLRDFRNRPHPIRVKVRYYHNVLTVWFHMGMSTKSEDFELCTRIENVELPKEGYFGVSAATGGLADDHDVLSFSTLSLTPPSEGDANATGLPQEEQDKLTKQYEEYQQKLEKQKEDYAQAHPEKVKKDEAQYESAYERDVRLVYEGQNAIHHMLNQLHTKTGELTVQANALHTLAATDHNRLSNMVTLDQTISRQEVNSMINIQQQVLTKLDEIKSSLGRIEPGGGGKRDVDSQSDMSGKLNDMQGAMDTLVHTVNNMASKQQFAGDQKKACPPPPPMPQCIGPGYFVFLIIAQIVMLVGYISYRNQKEAAAKKFF